jgi:hypothetical protein
MSNKPVKPNKLDHLTDFEVRERLLEVESLFVELVNVLKMSGVVSFDFQPPRTIVELDLLDKGFDVTPLNTRIPEFRKDKS